MFLVGDRILYPMHGAGVIEKIEKRDVLGETREYYILNLVFGNMDVMIPVDKSDEIGVRPIIEKPEIEEVFGILKEDASEMSNNWNRRYRENMDLLKTGDIFHVAVVVRNLVRVDRIKRLSTGEKKMLNNARQILESEITLASGEDAQKIKDKIEAYI